MVSDKLNEVFDKLSAESVVRCDGHKIFTLSATAERDDDFCTDSMGEGDHGIKSAWVFRGVAFE